MIGNSDDETSFPHKLLLINRQVSDLSKGFANNLSVNMKLSKMNIIIKLSKMIQSEWFPGRLLGPLLNVIQPLAKSVLIPLGLTERAAAAVKKWKAGTTALMISNKEMEDIIRIDKSFENSSLLLKEISKTIQNEAKEQKEEFLSMLLGILGAGFLAHLLASKRINRVGDGIMRAGSKGSLMKNVQKTKIFNSVLFFN